MTRLEKMKGQLGFLNDELKSLLDKEERTPEDYQKMKDLTPKVKDLKEKIVIEEEAEKVKIEEVESRGHEVPEGTKIEVQDPPEFRNFGEYLQAVASASQMDRGGHYGAFPTGIVDKRLLAMQKRETRAATGAEESVPSEGGFLVGSQYATDFIKRAYDESVLAPKCMRIGLTSNNTSIKVNGIDETSRADGSRWGGIRVYWTDEAAQMTSSRPKLKQVTLTLHKLTGLFYTTDELMQDAGALGDYAMSTFPREFAFKIDDEIYQGDGSGKPLGVLGCNAAVDVAAESGQAATTIVLENLAKMYMRMWNPGKRRAIWVANNDTIPQLITMAHPVGTGGGPVFISNVQSAPTFSIFGRPVFFIEHAKTLGTTGDLMFLDLGEYMFIDKGGIQSAMSMHLRFDYNETAFRWTYRCDGQPLWTSALTPFQGTNTVSPYISLATRS